MYERCKSKCCSYTNTKLTTPTTTYACRSIDIYVFPFLSWSIQILLPILVVHQLYMHAYTPMNARETVHFPSIDRHICEYMRNLCVEYTTVVHVYAVDTCLDIRIYMNDACAIK